MAVNQETDPLLPPETECDEDAVRRVTLVLTRFRRIQAAAALALLVLIAALAAARKIILHHDDYATYELPTTCLDVVVSTVCFELFVLWGVRRELPSWNGVGQYLSSLLLLVLMSKMWVYDAWGGRPAATAVLVTAFGLTVVQCVLFVCATQTVATKRTTLRWSACKQILRPYFIPRGLRNKIFVVLTWVVLLSGKVCGIYSPIVLGQIVTKLTMTPPQSCQGLIGVYCFLNLAPNLLREVQDNLYVKVWQVAYAEVAETTFRHLHMLSLEWHLKKKMGNIIRAMDRGMNGADSLMYYSMIYLFPAVASAIAAFIVFAVHFNQRTIAAVCFLAFTFYCWVTFVVTMWRRKFREAMNKHDNEMHDKASDSLINFETVKCFTNEEHEVDHYIKSVRDYQQGSFNTQASTSLLNISQSTTIQLAMLGSLMVAAYCALHHEDGFDAGEFVAIQAYVLTIFQPLSYLGTIYNMIVNSMVDIQNLSDILSATVDVADEPGALDLTTTLHNKKNGGGVSVEFRDVCFKYPSAQSSVGLNGISFSVPAGTTTALVGPTGSGKTTISRLLFRFYDADSGAVFINGEDVRHCTQKSVRKLIGVVPQDTTLFNETIRYNIQYGRLDASDADIVAAATAAQVHDFVMRNENGYDTMCGERGLKLSGGEKQRIAIARCLLKNPPVVLLDEATSALDNQTERDVQLAMECLEGRTTLMIAHRLSTVQRADQILVLKDGAIAERGTHHQLLAANGLYAAMWNMQLQEQPYDYSI